MNSRERVLNLSEGKPADRPPAMPITMMWSVNLIGANCHDYATRAQIQAAGQCAAAGQLGFDQVSVIFAGAGCEVPRHSPAENVRCFDHVV
jgi:uroporphyrinogen-III decarboxylase